VKYADFIRKVGERADIGDRFEAEKTSAVVLQTLCDRLSGKEANDLLAQLPTMFKELVVVSPSSQPIPCEEFVRRVADELQVEREEARKRIRAVFATLRQAVTWGELRDVLEELDPEYADLLA
jgi:uncharacterized protein (DUF2267 family)